MGHLSKCRRCKETFELDKKPGSYFIVCPKCDTMSTVIVGINDMFEYKVTQVKEITKIVRVSREELKGWEPESPEARNTIVGLKVLDDEVAEEHTENILQRPTKLLGKKGEEQYHIKCKECMWDAYAHSKTIAEEHASLHNSHTDHRNIVIKEIKKEKEKEKKKNECCR